MGKVKTLPNDKQAVHVRDLFPSCKIGDILTYRKKAVSIHRAPAQSKNIQGCFKNKTLIPYGIVRIVHAQYSNERDRKKIFTFLNKLFINYIFYGDGLLYSTKAIKKVLGTNYRKDYINTLLELGIIRIKETFYDGRKRETYKAPNICENEADAYPKRYFLESSTFNEALAEVTINAQKIKEQDGDRVGEDTFSNWVAADIRSLTIRLKPAQQKVLDFVGSQKFWSDLITNQKIEVLKVLNKPIYFDVHDINNGKSYEKITNEHLYAIADGRVMVQIGTGKKRKYYLSDSLEQFKDKKERETRFSHLLSIERLRKKIIYSKRNDTNNRLDSNLTNLPSYLLPYIKKQGQNLIELDLKTSQLSILAALLGDRGAGTPIHDLLDRYKRKSALKKELFGERALSWGFIDIVQKADVYQYTGDVLKLSRDAAKIELIRALFAPNGSESELSRIFPEFIRFMEHCKQYLSIPEGLDPKYQNKRNRHKTLAIYLQREESQLFIDQMYKDIKEAGLFAIPKHDSFLTTFKDMEHVRAILIKHLNKALGVDTYQLKSKVLNNKSKHTHTINKALEVHQLNVNQWFKDNSNTFINKQAETAKTKEKIKRGLKEEREKKAYYVSQKRLLSTAQNHTNKGLEAHKKVSKKRTKKHQTFNAKANIKRLNFLEFAKRLIEDRFKIKLDDREHKFILKQLEKRIRQHLSIRKLYQGADTPTIYKREVNKYFYQMIAYYPLFDIRKGFVLPSYILYNFDKLTPRIAKEYDAYLKAQSVGEGRTYHLLKDKQVREIVNARNGILTL